MNYKIYLTSLLLLLVGTLGGSADPTLKLVQVMKESCVVSERPYLLFYVSNSTGCYVETEVVNGEATRFLVQDNHNIADYINDYTTYYFISSVTGWKIQNKATEKYFPKPTQATNEAYSFVPTDFSSAGDWSLNFLPNGTFAPSCNGYSLNRYNSVLHGWDRGTANVNQFKIYEWHLVLDASKVYQLNSSGSWIFVPAIDDANNTYYYLYNVTEKKFAYPLANGNWEYRDNEAVPVSVVKQGSDGKYRITTKEGDKTFSINSETDLTVTVLPDHPTAAETTELNTAKANLLGGQTKITTVSAIDDGWYALRIHTDSNNPLYEGNFLYTLATPYSAGGSLYYPYPMSHGGEYLKHPAKDDVTYYFHLMPVERSDGNTYYHWQLPNGIYIVNYKNNYPIRYHQPLSDFIIGKNADENTFYIQSTNFRAQAYDGYIGKTARQFTESPTKLDIYKVDLASAGLTAWEVIFNEGADNIPLHCTRTDIHGSADVYNGGYFFLPSSVTKPLESDFTLEGMYGSPEIDDVNHTITVKYAPAICFEAKDVTVVQGSRTTGKGNTMQALLRIEVKPKAPCHPTSFVVNLAGAANFSQVQAYLSTADQLPAYYDDPSSSLPNAFKPTLLGSASISATPGEEDGVYTISVTTPANHLLKAGVSNYIWITADIKSDAVESDIVDASINSISYQNETATPTCDISSKGDPEGYMRIFYRQKYLWVSTENNTLESRYYRDPAILNLGSSTLLAFCDYRYDNVNGLGKDYDGADYGHRMDVMMRKSTNNGATWDDPVTVAAGSPGSASVKASGYAGPAVVWTGSKVICLMAYGQNAYDSPMGLTQISMSTSTNSGDTWSEPTVINIDWNGLNPSSYYVTPGKGLTYNGRVAFVINAKVSGRTQEYLLYSTDDGAHWTVDSTPLSGKGKESKLEVKNDGTNLLVMGRTPASKDTNNDLLYFKRSGEGDPSDISFDAILHTVIWKNDGDPQRLKDLRLYASFDRASTWKQLFYITPANAAASSMQKLSGGGTDDGFLAIFFEDGSIGNDENAGCYAMNYVVIDKAMVQEQSQNINTATVIVTSSTIDTRAPYVSGSGWARSVTTNQYSDFPGVVISADYGAFNRETNDGKRYFDLRPSAASSSNTITITAPEGYVIKSYTIKGISRNSAESYTLSAEKASTSPVTLNGSNTFEVDNIFSPSTTFTFANSGTSGSGNYALISDFHIVLTREEYQVALHKAQGKSYATLFTDLDLTEVNETTKAYYISGVEEEGVLTLVETGNDGRQIPKNTPVVLINSEGETYAAFTITTGLAQLAGGTINLLIGTLEEMTLNLTKGTNAVPNYNYSLGTRQQGSNGTPIVGFYQNGNANFTLGANRAYLVTNALSRSFGAIQGFDFSLDEGDDDLTPVKPVDVQTFDNIQSKDWYTLDGRKVSGMPHAKGIYVSNGKKIVIH